MIGFHFVENEYTDAQVAKHFDLLNATKPAAITILGGAQYNEAFSFAKRAKQAFPAMRVIFRHWKDDGDNGMHTRLTADDWWEKIGKLYVGSNLTILTDNESMADDLGYYARWQARAMELASKNAVSLAVGRFSTHNPPSAQWSQLDPMWWALAEYGELHVWSPNVYFSDTNLDGLSHIFGGWRRCSDLEIRTPVTIIGEFAYLRDIKDAHNGYRSVKMGGEDYANLLLKRYGNGLQAAGVPVCVYSIGEWPIKADTFSLDDGALNVLRSRLLPVSIDPKPLPPIPPEPPKPEPPKPEPPKEPEMTPLQAALTALKLVNEQLLLLTQALQDIHKLNAMVIQKIENGGI